MAHESLINIGTTTLDLTPNASSAYFSSSLHLPVAQHFNSSLPIKNFDFGILFEVASLVFLILARNYLDLANIEVKLYKSDKKIYQYMYNFKVDNEEVWFYFSEETQEGNRNIDEVSSDIVGCLYMNNQEYRVVGWKEVDGSEIETTLIIYITDTYYVKVCQEIEHAENEYEFIYYDHNKKQKSLEIEIEQELNMYKVSIEDKDYEGTLNNKMKFKMSDNKILCDIETKSYKGEVLIIINGDYHEYIFKEQEKEKSF